MPSFPSSLINTPNSPDEFYEIADGVLVVPRGSLLLEEVDVRHRFLDRLILPCPLGELSPAQIIAINRFREEERQCDPQFAKADRARRIISSGCKAIGTSDLLEIGMGKFPLASDMDLGGYFGVDIDDDAISFCRKQGYSCGYLKEVTGSFDTVAAVYSLHFSFSAQLFKKIAEILSDNPVMLSVVIDDGDQHFSALLDHLTKTLPLTRVVQSSVSRRERFIVSGNATGEQRFGQAVDAIERCNAGS